MLGEEEGLLKIAKENKIIFYGEIRFCPIGVDMLTKIASNLLVSKKGTLHIVMEQFNLEM